MQTQLKLAAVSFLFLHRLPSDPFRATIENSRKKQTVGEGRSGKWTELTLTRRVNVAWVRGRKLNHQTTQIILLKICKILVFPCCELFLTFNSLITKQTSGCRVTHGSLKQFQFRWDMLCVSLLSFWIPDTRMRVNQRNFHEEKTNTWTINSHYGFNS